MLAFKDVLEMKTSVMLYTLLFSPRFRSTACLFFFAAVGDVLPLFFSFLTLITLMLIRTPA